MPDCSTAKNDALGDEVALPNQMGFPRSCINIQFCEEHEEVLTEFVGEIWMF
jgi:hypothetical protein